MAPYVQEHIIASGRYPHLARALAEDDHSSEETFLFGLTCLLEGIAAYAAAQANHGNYEGEQ
jgi:hypothetical protein